MAAVSFCSLSIMAYCNGYHLVHIFRHFSFFHCYSQVATIFTSVWNFPWNYQSAVVIINPRCKTYPRSGAYQRKNQKVYILFAKQSHTAEDESFHRIPYLYILLNTKTYLIALPSYLWTLSSNRTWSRLIHWLGFHLGYTLSYCIDELRPILKNGELQSIPIQGRTIPYLLIWPNYILS